MIMVMCWVFVCVPGDHDDYHGETFHDQEGAGDSDLENDDGQATCPLPLLSEVLLFTKEMVVILVMQTLKAQPWEGEARSTCRITPGCFPGTSMAQVST